jgi:hypothetical protein
MVFFAFARFWSIQDEGPCLYLLLFFEGGLSLNLGVKLIFPILFESASPKVVVVRFWVCSERGVEKLKGLSSSGKWRTQT